MFDNKIHYTLRTEESGGGKRYFASFKDEQSVTHEAEVSEAVYLEFCQFIKTERNLRRWVVPILDVLAGSSSADRRKTNRSDTA